jgi:hypothetical protein
MRKHCASLIVALTLAGSSVAYGQAPQLPWGQNPDMLAWQTFVQVVAPAGNPQNTNVEFETWASDQDIYTDNPQWPGTNPTKTLTISALGNSHLRPGLLPQVVTPGQCGKPGDPAVAKQAGFPADGCIGEEVRRNWASFQYIVSNKLYSHADLAARYGKGPAINFPADAIELKGDWARVQDVMKWLNLTEQQVGQQYYTNTASDGKTTTKYALLSFHFSTKLLHNWFWTDFEQENNPGRCDDIGCHDSYGAVKANVQPRVPIWKSYGKCEKTKAVLAMFSNGGISDVWQHYCLKGTQTTSFTEPLRLGNSVIEAINASVPINKSSCISCHAYASFDNTGYANYAAAGCNYIGNIVPSRLHGYQTNDFVWGPITLPPPASPPAPCTGQ